MSRARSYGRGPDGLRPVAIEPGFVRPATGSALISMGETRVICTASAQESVPRWMTGKGRGWVTAEYGMLPASTGERKQRDATRGRLDGRSVEIQRLIGRSLRGVVDFEALGERTIYLDCDVLQADGGTRCASITGAYVALALACARLREQGSLESSPLTGAVAAVSCGIVAGSALLDLDYSEDSSAEVDANVVMTGEGDLLEVQATAERTPLSRASLDELLALAARRHRSSCATRRSRRSRLPPADADVRLLLATHNEHKRRELARLLPEHEIALLPDAVELPPEDGETFAENALGKARAAAARDRRGRRSPTTPGSRPPRSAAPPACARRATPASTPATSRTSPSCCARSPPAARCDTSARSSTSIPRRGIEQVFQERCTGHARRAPARRGRLRL